VTIEFIVEPGPVRRRGDKMQQSMRDSVDFIAGGRTRDGRLVLFGIEVKTRTTARTSQAERDLDRSGDKYIALDSLGPRLRQLIPSKH
jgi:hypothetical protein